MTFYVSLTPLPYKKKSPIASLFLQDAVVSYPAHWENRDKHILIKLKQAQCLASPRAYVYQPSAGALPAGNKVLRVEFYF